ncbi:MAG: DUF6029 family protein [Bacteroidota bacterium]
MTKYFLYISCLIIIFLLLPFWSQSQVLKGSEVHGNFQTDLQYYNADSIIGAPEVPEKMLMRSFANIIFTNNNFSAGVRYESYLNTLQGFDSRYEGNGIPYRYATYSNEGLEITVGNFYEQFGNGLIFRSYEEWGLGYDNAMDGIRLKYSPYNGIYLKGLVGKQRFFFDQGSGIVRGADGEIFINEIFDTLAEMKTKIIIGGSFVSKYQPDQDPIYKLPGNVGAFAGRLNIIHGKINIMSEYANKINDPSSVNNYIYKPGESLLLTATYSTKGLGIMLSAKRVDNMDFRSDRTATGNDLNINYLPVITKQHAYSLTSMYPYATQPNGEMGFQAEVIYSFKKDSKLGGKYGTNLYVNYSAANSLKKTILYDGMGYDSDFFGIGDEVNFRDFNIEISKKFSKKVKTIFSYVNLVYNKDIIQGLSGYGTIYADIGVVDLTYKIKPKHSVRIELQHLSTKQDDGSWAMGLVEYAISPHWFIAAFDEYNYGNPDTDKKLNYFTVQAGYKKKANTITIGYGRQRQGIYCVGGVCRNVPASNGVTLAITSSF